MRVKNLPSLIAVATAVLLVIGVSSASGAASRPDAGSKSRSSHASVVISTRAISGLGRVLVNSRGRTLYMFVPDKRKKVTCVSACAAIWPPVKLPNGAKIVATGGVKAGLLRSDADPAGGRLVIYNNWPLYGYVGDQKAGDTFGQALNLNGGLWYVLSTSGAIITTKPHAGGAGGGGGGGGATTTTPTNTHCTDADGDGDQDAGGPDDGDGCL